MNGPLITADRLAAISPDTDLVVADCRWYLGEPDAGRAAYDQGHLPGAIYVSLDHDLSGPDGPGRHPLPSPEAFAATLARWGVGPSTTVVAYDDRGGAVASRLWWMLTDQGHDSAFVLDGGIQAWTDAGHPVTNKPSPEPEPSRQPGPGVFRSRPWAGVVERDAVAKRSSGTIVIDARSFERYAGFEEPVDPQAGHIPGAISVPMSHNLASDLTFLDPDELAIRFRGLGLDRGDVIAQCGSGVTACHDILAMEIAGLGRPKLYVGSWSDWSSSDMPIATGPTP